jgi:hypothetical protein
MHRRPEKSYRLRVSTLLATASLFTISAVIIPATAAHATTSPALNGSFVQPALIDGFTSTKLTTEDSDLTRAGITQQVLQWTADSKADTTVYPSGLTGYTQSTSTDVLGRTLTAADTAHITEYIGLATNADWWTNYANNSTWLTGQATAANALADDIHTKYGTHTSFGGWYIPFEVDNWNFTTSATWTAMASFYTTIVNHLHTLTPGLPVIIAPFFNTAGGQTSAQWTTMWESILANAPIDVIALQDGIGDGHATNAQLATWYAATQTAITTSSPSTKLWADTETYDTNFHPLAIGTVVADMQQEQSYVTDFLSFSYDHYDSPQQVSSFYDTTYRNYITSGTVEASAPTTPTALHATAANALTVNLSWTASTDNVGVAGYQIYRNSVLVQTVLGTGTTFTDGQLDPSTLYTYSVAAFDAAGNVSANSSTASATTPAGPSNPTNDAAGKTYTSSLAADPSYPDSGGELTNGTYGTTSYSNAAWQGRNTASTYTFTVDLGTTKTIKEVDSDWLQVRSVFIFLPTQLTVATSTNGTTFNTIGAMNAPNVGVADQARKYRLISISNSARYVRVTVTPASSAWSFTDELEVRQ